MMLHWLGFIGWSLLRDWSEAAPPFPAGGLGESPETAAGSTDSGLGSDLARGCSISTVRVVTSAVTTSMSAASSGASSPPVAIGQTVRTPSLIQRERSICRGNFLYISLPSSLARAARFISQEMRIVPNLDGNGFVNLGRSSSNLSVAEMAQLIELILAFCAERGVVIFDSDQGGAGANNPRAEVAA